MQLSSRPHEPAILTSWKEVAAYLGKGVRTVQRWEKYDRLPVRRVAGTTKIIVYREELDRWLYLQPLTREGASEVETTGLSERIELSKTLRERHHELRKSLNNAVQRLVQECEKISISCGGAAKDARQLHRKTEHS